MVGKMMQQSGTYFIIFKLSLIAPAKAVAPASPYVYGRTPRSVCRLELDQPVGYGTP